MLRTSLATASLILWSGHALSAEVLIDDFSQRAEPPSWTDADQWINSGDMLGGFRVTDSFGGLTPVTKDGVQTGYSWRDRVSNTVNGWGIHSNLPTLNELNLSLGQEGYISANFSDISEGILLRMEIGSYVSGTGYQVRADFWTSPTITVSGGPQIVSFHMSDFLPDSNGALPDAGNIDAVRFWVSQTQDNYPPVGQPAYILDSVVAVSAVPEPLGSSLFIAGLLAMSGIVRLGSKGGVKA